MSGVLYLRGLPASRPALERVRTSSAAFGLPGAEVIPGFLAGAWVV